MESIIILIICILLVSWFFYQRNKKLKSLSIARKAMVDIEIIARSSKIYGLAVAAACSELIERAKKDKELCNNIYILAKDFRLADLHLGRHNLIGELYFYEKREEEYNLAMQIFSSENNINGIIELEKKGSQLLKMKLICWNNLLNLK